MRQILFYIRVLYWCWVKDGDIIVARDCSGSTTSMDSWLMVDLINGILNVIGLIRIIDFDNKIRSSQYQCAQLHERASYYGGGTSFDEVIVEAERTKAAGLIICSDMYPFGRSYSQTVPIMGVLIGGNDEVRYARMLFPVTDIRELV